MLPEIDFRAFVFRFCKVTRVWPWGRCDGRRCDAAAWAVAGVTGAGCACEGGGVPGAGLTPVPVTSQRQAFQSQQDHEISKLSTVQVLVVVFLCPGAH